MRARAVPTATLPDATVLDAISLIADNLRQADVDEITATTTQGTLEELLVASWRASSLSWLVLDRTSLPIAIFGAAPHVAPGLGVVWLMGTEGVEREWVAVARQTGRHLAEMHAQFPTLWNLIDARNGLSVHWLERAGFRMIDAHPHHGPEGRLFYEYARTS